PLLEPTCDEHTPVLRQDLITRQAMSLLLGVVADLPGQRQQADLGGDFQRSVSLTAHRSQGGKAAGSPLPTGDPPLPIVPGAPAGPPRVPRWWLAFPSDPRRSQLRVGARPWQGVRGDGVRSSDP